MLKKSSKHSHYQILPSQLVQYFEDKDYLPTGKVDSERLLFVIKNINLKNKTILDIGGNTGFFTFESINSEAKHVTYIEGNEEHANFAMKLTKILKLTKQISIKNQYFNFTQKRYDEKFNVCFLLNVLHHVGDDFNSGLKNIGVAKEKIIKYLNNSSSFCDILIFQLGFNWQGNVHKPLFKNGTKKEMIDFIKKGTKNHWNIKTIGIAEIENGDLVYNKLNKNNINRNDEIGEFKNRPIFIMKKINV
ncbi:MAG: class I SAM-dependent methyltransferase [Patescibacteria group bacterium]|nr:class I SAM-dependent methyltransferase [Patescibacteria group bacterium]